MKHYSIEIRPAAKRELKRVDEKHLIRIAHAIDSLANDPRPKGCLKMKGKEGFYRIRVGEYRIVYDIQETLLVILILHAGTRQSIYKENISSTSKSPAVCRA